MSHSTKQVLADQFLATDIKKNWVAPLQSALQDVTAAEADHEFGNAAHSIRQIVNHLLFWNERYLHRLKGSPLPPIEIENSDTFDQQPADWDKTLQQLFLVMKTFHTEILLADDLKLEAPLATDKNASWYEIISDINIHNAYHIGQIVTLRKLQSSWDAKKYGA